MEDAFTREYWEAALRFDTDKIKAMSQALANDLAAEAERQRVAKRSELWGCEYDLVTDGVVEMVDYAAPEDVKVNDLVIITRGENPGHVAIVEETVRPLTDLGLPTLRQSRAMPDGFARLKRVWPSEWRSPSGTYWAPEFRFDAFAELRPKVPQFVSTGEAEWWMHDARKIEIGQEAAFTLTVRTYLDEKPWRDQFEDNEYTGTITEIVSFDMPYWYRNRPLAKGKFRILHFDDDMNPQLIWVEEIVRL